MAARKDGDYLGADRAFEEPEPKVLGVEVPRPGGRPPALTRRLAGGRPAAGSAPAPDLSATLDSAESAKDGFRLVAEDAERRALEAESRAAELELALRRERRKSSPRVDSDPPPSESLVITKKGARVPSWVFWLALAAIPVLGGLYSTWKRFEVVLGEWDTTVKRVAALESRAQTCEDASSAQRAELVQQRKVNAALDCQLRHVRAAFERGGVTLDALPRGGVDWRSEYLPDSRRVRTAPAWRAVDDCPELPEGP